MTSRDSIQSNENDPKALSWKADVSRWDLSTPIVVEDGQVAIFLLNQTLCAIVEKGTYPLNWILDAQKVPEGSDLQIYYFSTRIFSDQRWGTAAPIIVNDTTIGINALRAHGTFAFQLHNPKRLWQHLPNDYVKYTTDDLINQLRSIILENFSTAINENHHDVLNFLSQRERFSQEIKTDLIHAFEAYGLSLVDFLVQSVSAPEEQTQSMEAFTKIEKLNQMLKQGLITPQEYDEKKKKLLEDI